MLSWPGSSVHTVHGVFSAVTNPGMECKGLCPEKSSCRERVIGIRLTDRLEGYRRLLKGSVGHHKSEIKWTSVRWNINRRHLVKDKYLRLKMNSSICHSDFLSDTYPDVPILNYNLFKQNDTQGKKSSLKYHLCELCEYKRAFVYYEYCPCVHTSCHFLAFFFI